MKFIREPIFNIISCKCGTAFQPEAGDYLCYEFKDDNPFEVKRILTRCPTCGSHQEVTVIGKIDVTSSEAKKSGE